MADLTMRHKCLNCGYEYDPDEGCADLDIAAGTAWEDLPEEFLCPQCGSDRRDFEPCA